MDPEARQFLQAAVEAGASDLHLTAGSRPFMRHNGELNFFDAPQLTPDRARRMVLGFMDDEQQQQFLRHRDLDFSFDGGDELGRCRVNALMQFRGPSIIFRIIPKTIPTLDDLGMPASLGRLTEWTQGLVLVTGPAGCGKSTTAAALVDLVNSNRKDHIITVEDPVEYIHPSKNCNVTQRQVPIHTKTFAAALKAALREDPDVIMIGEMRDLETISLAMTAAETGHLVIGTLHTKSASRTIDRIVDVFPSDQQAQVRTMLSEALRGIITQQLVRRADGSGRVAALEVLYVNTAVSNLVRDSKTFQLPSVMQTGRKQGQKLMDDSLKELAQSGVITKDDAMKAAENPNKLF
ncbi:MAG: PilT/PilU family type 4a pilus ATPase [Phycisphaera sp.]|nr:PilT/PilU family type 4a pilus ATPase [Phycisphaera sp.]